MSAGPPRPTPPWVFTPLMLPFGAAVGYLQIAAPFWLRAAGVSLVDIGAVSATAFLPHAWKILWVPLLDVGPYRKRWYGFAMVVTAALLGSLALLGDPSRHLTLFTLLVTAAQVTASTSSAALDAREGFTGVLICLTPVGCGAMTNLFSGIATDYRAPQHLVEVVNGLGGGVSSAIGAVVGGWIADRMDRRVAYGLSGGVTALAAVAMLVAPMTAATYAWGTLAYDFANGIAFATWAGMVLEIVGHGAGVATKCTLFTATSNQAISYVTWLDGKASEWHASGARGALAFDAAITFVGLGVLLVIVAYARRGVTPAPARSRR